MPIIDIIILICFIPAIVLGLSKGLVKQVVGLVSLVLGLIIGSRYAPALSTVLIDKFQNSNEVAMRIIAFILIFMIVSLVLSLIGKLLTKILKTLALGWINSLLGVVFSIINTIIILSLLIMLFESINSSFPLLNEKGVETLNNAPIYSMVRDLGSKILPFLQSLIGADTAASTPMA